jgi:sugar lactone lactonase YvrE
MVLTVSLQTQAVLLDGLAFPEAPRWRDGELWSSDMAAQQVTRVDLDGTVNTVVEVPGQPSGLGWLPDGRLLVVSMTDRKLLRLDPDDLTVVADLSQWAPFHCNDMVVDAEGRAHVGNFGFDPASDAERPTVLLLVTPEGEVWVASSKCHEVLRVRKGGEVTHRVATENQAVACALGGPDGRTLFVLNGQITPDRETSCVLGAGRIETPRVDVAGAGCAPSSTDYPPLGANSHMSPSVSPASPPKRKVLSPNGS